MKNATIILLLTLLCPLCRGDWKEHGIIFSPQAKIRIAVLPVRADVKIKKLKSIRDMNEYEIGALEADPKTEAVLVSSEISRAAGEITAYAESRLGASRYFEVVPGSSTAEALMSLGAPETGFLTDSARIRKLGELLSVQAVLDIKLSGYGRIKKKWQVILLGIGVGEGIVFGAEIQLVTRSRELAMAGAAEEIIQEMLEFGIGIGVFNKLFTPVILESRMISVSDGKELWGKTAFNTVDRKTLKKFPEKERKSKELRLRITWKESVDKIIGNLEKKAAKVSRRHT
jgi:hypothetical protein